MAYLTNYDSTNTRHWSGLGYYMAQSLEKQGVELIRINCFVKFSLLQRTRRWLMRIVARKVLQIERENAYLKRLANKADKELSGQAYDIIFSPGSLPVSFLTASKPIVFFTDATYDCLARLYTGQKSLSRYSLTQGNYAEAKAIKNASLIFYTSEWAKENAVTIYNADSNKIRQLCFGPNLPAANITTGDLKRKIAMKKGRKQKTFLFIGVDWYRKGAGTAIETVSRLNEMGLPSTIILVGCTVPDGVRLPTFVTHYPFISKSDFNGLNTLQELFRQADFFLLPTLADCTPVVFSEAASYGLPAITTDVGGIKSVVVDGVTGYCISTDNFVEEATKKIVSLCRDEASYESFCLSAYYHYKTALNWDITGEKAVEAIQQLIKPKQPSRSLVYNKFRK